MLAASTLRKHYLNNVPKPTNMRQWSFLSLRQKFGTLWMASLSAILRITLSLNIHYRPFKNTNLWNFSALTVYSCVEVMTHYQESSACSTCSFAFTLLSITVWIKSGKCDAARNPPSLTISNISVVKILIRSSRPTGTITVNFVIHSSSRLYEFLKR